MYLNLEESIEYLQMFHALFLPVHPELAAELELMAGSIVADMQALESWAEKVWNYSYTSYRSYL